MKKLYIGSNLKMYKTIESTENYLRELNQLTGDISEERMELFILPSYLAIERSVSCNKSGRIRLGVQNICWEDEGQFTGEVSVPMIKELGIDLAMVGHSERRQIFGEKNEELNQKVKNLLKHDITALLCIGETASDKKYRIGKEVLREQLKIGLSDIKPKQTEQLWIAYEPVWSIGVQGIPATPEYAEEMHKAIRQCLKEIFAEGGEDIPVLYGGSVNAENAGDLIQGECVDGLFIGRAAWNAKSFSEIIHRVLI